jgi:predicted CoA-binding protein
MTTKAAIDEFMALKKLAVAGASRNVNKFGYRVYHELKDKGYTVYPINPNAETIDGDACYASVAVLPDKPDGLILVTPPAQSEALVREAAKAGITHVWLQQGAFTPAAVELCNQNNINCIAGECIFMFSEPAAWFHRAHRWVNTVIGKAPK